MTLDPGIAAILDVLNTNFPDVRSMNGAQVRAVIRGRLQLPDEPESVADVTDTAIDGPGGPIPIRIYRPSNEPLGTIVFAHGGGFVFCDLDTHDTLCRAMANSVNAVVVAVDYRLAPENPWPAAAEDVFAVTRWAANQSDEFHSPPDRLAVVGDSAGGNLAAVTAIMARDHGGPHIAAQVLLYPAIGAEFDTESYRTYATGYYSTRDTMQWYWDQYVPDPRDRTHPYANPLKADLHGLPPALVITAGFDPCRTEGELFAESLTAAGVPTVHRCYPGGIHGFLTMPNQDLGARARAEIWSDIRELLAHSDPE